MHSTQPGLRHSVDWKHQSVDAFGQVSDSTTNNSQKNTALADKTLEEKQKKSIIEQQLNSIKLSHTYLPTLQTFKLSSFVRCAIYSIVIIVICNATPEINDPANPVKFMCERFHVSCTNSSKHCLQNGCSWCYDPFNETCVFPKTITREYFEKAKYNDFIIVTYVSLIFIFIVMGEYVYFVMCRNQKFARLTSQNSKTFALENVSEDDTIDVWEITHLKKNFNLIADTNDAINDAGQYLIIKILFLSVILVLALFVVSFANFQDRCETNEINCAVDKQFCDDCKGCVNLQFFPDGTIAKNCRNANDADKKYKPNKFALLCIISLCIMEICTICHMKEKIESSFDNHKTEIKFIIDRSNERVKQGDKEYYEDKSQNANKFSHEKQIRELEYLYSHAKRKL